MKKLVQYILMVAMLANFELGLAAKYIHAQKDKKFGEVNADQGLIYFVRPMGYLGGMYHFWIFVDERPVSVTRGHNYTFTYVSPGKHIIWSRSPENVSAIEMDIKGGETYYIKQKVKAGGLYRVKLEHIEKEKALAKMKMETLYYSTMTDEGRARAEELSDKWFERAKEKAAKAKEKSNKD